MIYVRFDGQIPVEASYDPQKTDVPVDYGSGWHMVPMVDKRWQTRNDWKSFEEVTQIARLLEATTRQKFLPVDAGSHTSPRYDLVEPPKVGDPVSYSYNGDTYPDGEITKITPTYQITTSGGHKYRRPGNRGYWLRVGGTWSLVKGHIYEQNPSV